MKVGLIAPPTESDILPLIYKAAFEAIGLHDWRYVMLPTGAPDLPNRLKQLVDEGYVGVNVASPFKQKVIPLLDRVSMAARGIGAVNAIIFEDGRFVGHNTDSIGFMIDLATHQVNVHGQRVLVLGAGSAAHAVVLGLSNRGAHVIVVARRDDSAWQLRDNVRRGISRQLRIEVQPWNVLPRLLEDVHLIVNCTPVGLAAEQMIWPHDLPFPTGTVVYDLIYQQPQTPFMKAATDAGLRAIGGLGMLVHQAAVTFELWTQREAPVDIMMQTAKDVAHGETNTG